MPRVIIFLDSIFRRLRARYCALDVNQVWRWFGGRREGRSSEMKIIGVCIGDAIGESVASVLQVR